MPKNKITLSIKNQPKKLNLFKPIEIAFSLINHSEKEVAFDLGSLKYRYNIYAFGAERIVADVETDCFLDETIVTLKQNEIIDHTIIIDDIQFLPKLYVLKSESGYIDIEIELDLLDRKGKFIEAEVLQGEFDFQFDKKVTEPILDNNGETSIYLFIGKDIYAEDSVNGYTKVTVDKENFKALSKNIIVDDIRVFINERRKSKLNPKNLRIFTDTLIGDDETITTYFEKQKVDEPQNFVAIGGNYFKDSKHIYFLSGSGLYKLKGCKEIATFSINESGIPSCKDYIYAEDRFIKSADRPTFQVLEFSPQRKSIVYSKDKSNAYFFNNKIKKADVSSFIPITLKEKEYEYLAYALDKNYVFEGGEIDEEKTKLLKEGKLKYEIG